LRYAVAEAVKKAGSRRQIKNSFIIKQWAARYYAVFGIDQASIFERHRADKLTI
jgi:hypothetical protein